VGPLQVRGQTEVTDQPQIRDEQFSNPDPGKWYKTLSYPVNAMT